ncbi:MAG: hypothetical protein ACREB8_03940 [Pseudolabrys sp.]
MTGPLEQYCSSPRHDLKFLIRQTTKRYAHAQLQFRGATRMSPMSRYRSVPLHRRWINDIFHFGKKSHTVVCNWQLNVAPALAARAGGQPAISWTAMWMKALALVAQRRSVLRTAYRPFPWAHLYVHPHSNCAVVIERTWQGEEAVFFEVIEKPDTIPIAELVGVLRKLKQEPVESIITFRLIIAIARLPVLVRRFLWHLVLYWGLGRFPAELLGTIGINPFPTGGTITQTASPIPFVFFIGLVEPNGDTQIQFVFDHRVIDGAEAYRLLRDVEATMNRDIVAELKENLQAPAMQPARIGETLHH